MTLFWFFSHLFPFERMKRAFVSFVADADASTFRFSTLIEIPYTQFIRKGTVTGIGMGFSQFVILSGWWQNIHYNLWYFWVGHRTSIRICYTFGSGTDNQLQLMIFWVGHRKSITIYYIFRSGTGTPSQFMIFLGRAQKLQYNNLYFWIQDLH